MKHFVDCVSSATRPLCRRPYQARKLSVKGANKVHLVSYSLKFWSGVLWILTLLLSGVTTFGGASSIRSLSRSSCCMLGYSVISTGTTRTTIALGARRSFVRTLVRVHSSGGSSSNNMKSFTTWNDDSSNHATALCVPPLTSSCHKGSSGRIGILGGSARYTGAPYYAAMASLKVGADLAFVFCAEEAAIPIKSYSPELMVAPVYSSVEFDKALEHGLDTDEPHKRKLVEQMVSQVEGMFDRMHVLVIGPGLGRCPLVLQSTAEIITRARKANLPMVLDADGLFLLTQPETRNILTGYKRVVLTPNVAEYGRLLHSLRDKEDDDEDDDDIQPQLSTLEKLLEGNVIVKKGQYDELSSVVQTFHDGVSSVKRHDMVCKEMGGLKRSGGIGDVLAGTLGTFVAWQSILSSKEEKENDTAIIGNDNDMDAHDRLVLACWSACCVVKRATNYAFQEKRRSMTAPDVLDNIGKAMDNMTSSSIQQDK